MDIQEDLTLVCGGCGKKYDNINKLKGENKKICPECEYGLFMIVLSLKEEEYLWQPPELDNKQKEIIIYIKDRLNSSDILPTPKEIQEALSLKSVSTVYYHLNTLKSKGFITFKQGKLHTIKLLPRAIAEENFLSVSDRQGELLKIINDYINKNGISPTTQELQEIIGVQSVATLAYHLDKLQEAGLINKTRYQHRSLNLTEEGISLLRVLFGGDTI